MSKVKLIVRKRNSLSDYRIVDVRYDISNDTKVECIVQTDFDREEDGSVQTSDNLDPVVYIENINNLTGQILTIADASFQDPEQRKAAKDLLSKAIWGWYHAVGEYPSGAWYKEKNKNKKD